MKVQEVKLFLRVLAFVGFMVEQTKNDYLVQGRNWFGLFLRLTVMLRLSCSLRVSATQDTDKPEIQPVSKPESLHSIVLS